MEEAEGVRLDDLAQINDAAQQGYRDGARYQPENSRDAPQPVDDKARPALCRRTRALCG